MHAQANMHMRRLEKLCCRDSGCIMCMHASGLSVSQASCMPSEECCEAGAFLQMMQLSFLQLA